MGAYCLATARLVLINGAPGSGKSTIAQALAQDRSMTLALNIDGLKHSLGRWDEDPSASGLHARRLTLALASEQLRAGFDLVIGQYLARAPFIEDLERLASPDHQSCRNGRHEPARAHPDASETLPGDDRTPHLRVQSPPPIGCGSNTQEREPFGGTSATVEV